MRQAMGIPGSSLHKMSTGLSVLSPDSSQLVSLQDDLHLGYVLGGTPFIHSPWSLTLQVFYPNRKLDTFSLD